MKISKKNEHGIWLSDTSFHSVHMVYKMSNLTIFTARVDQGCLSLGNEQGACVKWVVWHNGNVHKRI